MTDELFSRLNRGTFQDRQQDPNSTVHEMMIGGANIQPAGWYSDHSYSSSIGQTNLLKDPVFEGLVATSLTLTAAKQTRSEWAAHYVINSGATHTILALGRSYVRGDFHNNPFTSATSNVSYTTAVTGTADTNVYVYPDEDLTPTGLPTLDYLVASVKLYRQDAIDPAVTTCTAVLEILENGVVVATSPTAHDFLADNIYQLYPMSVNYKATGATFRANAYRWRMNVHIVQSGVGVAQIRLRWGETQLHFGYTPDPIPFTPQIAGWSPSVFPLNFSLTGIVAATAISANTNNWDPGALYAGYSVLQANPSAAWDLTGIVAADANGRVLLLTNVGNFTLTLKNQSASSTAGNRFQCPGLVDYALLKSATVMLYYNNGVGWYIVG